MIAANQVGFAQGGFESDNNEVLVLWPEGQHLLELGDKRVIATQLIDLLADRYNQVKGRGQ